ncbi:hypothetical protein KIN20_023976 [Parelaphostrongylus tenuis]|uniref:Lipoprotein n=1 Tax=Parelaphostrongylus tenuis TaxID=148309 RepID=A0AAD5MSQ4_PARTN|nr:hypothetical protein KIN20_023976 [Parelaphostrongylus tenuis]
MHVLISVAKLPTNSHTILLLTALSTVFGCGVMPAGQRSTRNFTVNGFSLPVAMVYSTAADAPTRVPGIATSKEGAKRFVERLVLQTVFDVLENQARSALLPDAVTSAILSQLTVAVTYTPLVCTKIHVGLADKITMRGYSVFNDIRYSRQEYNGFQEAVAEMEKESGCIIVSNTVTGICTNTGGAPMTCETGNTVKMAAVSGPPLIISGSLSTTNIIMANWSRAMWQSVVNRAVRMLASGPYRSHFFSAIAAVD